MSDFDVEPMWKYVLGSRQSEDDFGVDVFSAHQAVMAIMQGPIDRGENLQLAQNLQKLERRKDRICVEPSAHPERRTCRQGRLPEVVTELGWHSTLL